MQIFVAALLLPCLHLQLAPVVAVAVPLPSGEGHVVLLQMATDHTSTWACATQTATRLYAAYAAAACCNWLQAPFAMLWHNMEMNICCGPTATAVFGNYLPIIGPTIILVVLG
jgi:hypothetical protein